MLVAFSVAFNSEHVWLNLFKCENSTCGIYASLWRFQAHVARV